jgi:hypothetical protein
MPSVADGTLARRMENRRANGLDDILVAPTVCLTMDVETCACLRCGGWPLYRHLPAAQVPMVGEAALGQALRADAQDDAMSQDMRTR